MQSQLNSKLGHFISLEGVEGMGKSSLMAPLVKYLQGNGIEVVTTREPGGTAFAESVRSLLLHTESAIEARTEALLMYAARNEHVHQVIMPALARGAWVVSDRFSDASMAYQGYGRGLGLDWMMKLDEAVLSGFKPHLTLLLDAPIEVGRARIRARTADRIEQEADTFFEQVRSGYLQLAENDPERIKRIDAANPPEVVVEQAIVAIQQTFPELT